MAIEGDVRELHDVMRSRMEEIKNEWSSQGKRVILLARKVISKDYKLPSPTSTYYEDEIMHHAKTDLILVGIVGIVDPPRDEIPYVVSTLRGAGIRILMVTSLSPFTQFYLTSRRSLVTSP